MVVTQRPVVLVEGRVLLATSLMMDDILVQLCLHILSMSVRLMVTGLLMDHVLHITIPIRLTSIILVALQYVLIILMCLIIVLARHLLHVALHLIRVIMVLLQTQMIVLHVELVRLGLVALILVQLQILPVQ